MKSKWKVTSNPIGGQTMYAAFRIKDTSQPDHSGNREYAGDYIPDRAIAEFVVGQLNKGASRDMAIKSNYGVGKAYVGKPINGEYRGLILDRLTDRIIKTKKCIDWDSARLEADAAIKRIDKRARLPENSGRFEFHGVEGKEESTND